MGLGCYLMRQLVAPAGHRGIGIWRCAGARRV